MSTERKPAVYMLSLLAVHGCTCAALISALCYRTINMMGEDDAVAWSGKKRWLLNMPLVKFGFGTVCYVSSVMLRSFYELGDLAILRWVSLGIGIGSVSMMLGS